MSDRPTTPAAPSGGRTYRGLTAEQRHAERRERLLATGRELFADEGFAATGVRELCRAARVSERAFYDTVGGREALLREVYLQATDEVIADIRAALPGAPADLRGRLHAGLAAFFRSIEAEPRRGRLIYVESLGRGQEIEDARREGLRRFTAVILEEIAGFLPAGAPAPATLEIALSAAVLAVGEIAYRLAESPDVGFTGAQAAEQLTTAFVAAGEAFGLGD